MKGQKTGGKNFELGNSIGKLGGRPPTSPEIRAARKLDGKIFAEMWGRDDNGARIVEQLFEMAQQGNLAAAQIILDRVLGKVTDKVLHSTNKPTGVRLSDWTV